MPDRAPRSLLHATCPATGKAAIVCLGLFHVTTLAFIGLGAMGTPMARNLASRGFAVRAYDVRPGAAGALADAGVVAAASVAEACAGAEIALLMVVNAAQAQDVLFAQGGLDALSPGATVILSATCAPAIVAAIAERVVATGRRFVDAPVSGGVVGARAASLTIMAAGAPDTMAAIRPVLEALGTKIFVVGTEPGQGATAKVVNQLLCGVHIAAAAEALSFAERAGLDLAMMLDLLGGSAASSWMLKDRGPRMTEHDPGVTSAVDIFVKDLGLVMEAGRDLRCALPLAALSHQLFLSVSGTGDGAADDSQVIRAYGRLGGRAEPDDT